MRKIFTIIVLLVASVTLFAQSDVTKFLGIPVDGFKPDMIKALKAKGFVSTSYDPQVLEGEFNGTDVDIHIVTNNNKVYRIVVYDKNTISETDIRIRFNNLCSQFKNNPKYVSFSDYTIPNDEDISYEMLVNNKRYEAAFYQKTEMSEEEIQNGIKNALLQKYTEEELINATDEMKEDMIDIAMSYTYDIATKKTVWFMISEYYGKYYIAMYYDNKYNQANGDDL